MSIEIELITKKALTEENFQQLTGCDLPLRLVLGCTGIYALHSFEELRDQTQPVVVFKKTSTLEVIIDTQQVYLKRNFDFNDGIIENGELKLKEEFRQKGAGLRVSSSQIDYSTLAYFKRMECAAVGVWSIRHLYIGYYNWPSQGWLVADHSVEKYYERLRKLEINPAEFCRINDLLNYEGLIEYKPVGQDAGTDKKTGREIWLEEGIPLDVYFDLAEGSDSRIFHKKYLLYKIDKMARLVEQHHAKDSDVKLSEEKLSEVKYQLEFLTQRIKLFV